jgi:hypothetical protein
MTPLKSFLLLSLLAMAGPLALAQPTLHAFGPAGQRRP